MTTLNDIITVNIERGTTAISRAAFNIPCFIDEHTNFSERARVYSKIEDVSVDFPTTSNAHKAATAFFGQEEKPPRIVIGRKQVNAVKINFPDVVNIGDIFKVKIKGITGNVVEVTAAATTAATQADAVSKMVTAITAAAIPGITATNSSPTVTVTVAPGGSAWSCTAVSTGLSITNFTLDAETWVNAIDSVLLENSSWYALTCATRTIAHQQDIAAHINAMSRIYGTATQDANALTNSTADIGYILKDLNRDNTFVVYAADANTTFPECAYIGACLPSTPGSNTWKFKQLSGVGKIVLNATQITNLQAKNYNFVEGINDVNFIAEGKAAGGEFIDVMVLVHWTAARIQERVYSRLINTKKIPYTPAGFSVIEAEIRAVLSEGVRNGGYAENPPFTVTMPDINTIDSTLKAQRILDGVTFKATLAGAIHFVRIQGRVEL